MRSLATTAAAGVVSDEDLPPGLFARGAATASRAALLARGAGADAAHAFCVGILHDLGAGGRTHRPDGTGGAGQAGGQEQSAALRG